MSLITLAATYVLGGLTFLPLLLAVILLPAWLLLPRIEDLDEKERRKSILDGEDGLRREALLAEQEEKYGKLGNSAEAAASATFAVLRSYHFPSATAALNTKGGGVNGSTDGAGDGGGSGSSESVYQSMYRSVFDRRKDGHTGSSSVLEIGNGNMADGSGALGSPPTRTKAKTVGASVFYIVLRHGHLMLYDSPAQLEVRHVISLAHHAISLSGGEEELDGDIDSVLDGELFIKRTAIVLTPINLPNGHHQPRPAHPNPFYLFSNTCSEKEDFYHALLSTRARPPIPQPLLPQDIIKLQSTLHSTSLTPETRALNALLGRLFLAINRTPSLENLIHSKITKKIARVSKPAFIASLAVKSISLGDAAPILSNPRLKDINVSGDMTIAFDVRYTGNLRVTIAAVARLDLGTRFKARTVDVVLATSIQRLSGHVLVRVKPPPSNRIWFCFEAAPEMEIKVEPVVSSRQVTYSFILRAIEERIRGVVNETLVKPNWDDVPFFDTRGQSARGGIWADEGSDVVGSETDPVKGAGETTNAPASADGGLGARNEKTMSMPALATTTTSVDPADSSGTSSGSETTIATATTSSTPVPSTKHLKRRTLATAPLPLTGHASTVSLPSEDTGTKILPPPKPLRSPSFASPPISAPSVAVDVGAYGLPVRSDDAALQPVQAKKKWRAKSQQELGRRVEAVDALREMGMRDRERGKGGGVGSSAHDGEEASTSVLPGEEGEVTAPGETGALDDVLAEGSRGLDDDEDNDGDPWSGTPGQTRMDSDLSSISSSKSGPQRRAEQRKNLLATTAAATTAARNWGWNALANARARQQPGAGRGNANAPPLPARFRGTGTTTNPSSPSEHQHQQPIGRGQPLPPPGTPLPGPEKSGVLPKSLWSAAAGLAAAGTGSVRRKPVLPPRRVGSGRSVRTTGMGDSVEDLGGGNEGSGSGRQIDKGGKDHEEEFGPWNENSGLAAASVVGGGQAATVEDDESADDFSGVSTPFDDNTSEATELREDGHQEALSSSQQSKPTTKVPPPLPARRRKVEEREPAIETPAEPDVLSEEKDHDAGLAQGVDEHPLEYSNENERDDTPGEADAHPEHRATEQHIPPSPDNDASVKTAHLTTESSGQLPRLSAVEITNTHPSSEGAENQAERRSSPY